LVLERWFQKERPISLSNADIFNIFSDMTDLLISDDVILLLGAFGPTSSLMYLFTFA